MLRYVLKPANLFTASSLFCGFYSIVLSASARPGDSGVLNAAAVLILFAGLFDMLDGPVARLTHTQSDFGKHLDSFADLVSFGIAPGLLLFQWGLAEIQVLGFAVAFAFVLAGCFRLARFNLDVDADDPAYSRGLTITVSGVAVAVLVIYHHRTGLILLESQLAILLLTVFLSYLMVSEIRFRTIKSFRISVRLLALVALAGFGLLIGALLLDAVFVLVGLAFLYIGGGLAETALTHRRRRWALSVEDEEGDAIEDLDILDDLDDDLPLPAIPGAPPRRFRWWPFHRD